MGFTILRRSAACKRFAAGGAGGSKKRLTRSYAEGGTRRNAKKRRVKNSLELRVAPRLIFYSSDCSGMGELAGCLSGPGAVSFFMAFTVLTSFAALQTASFYSYVGKKVNRKPKLWLNMIFARFVMIFV
jgi:hypothetical protein